MNLPRATTIVLRLLATLQLLTGLIAISPLAWIAWWHLWLGLGPLPDDAVLRYVLRGGALVQAAIGVLLWVIASDVARYRPLVITVGAIYLVSAPAFYSVNAVAGMPWFWCWIDAGSCFLTGATILALSLSWRPGGRAEFTAA